MIFRNATRVVVVLAATAALAQSAQPGTTPGAPILNRQGLTARTSPVGNKTADPQGLAAMRERVEDLQSTLSQMRVVLRQMQANAAKSKATDSLSKANLDMWGLMVGHLDKELQQMRVTLAAREDLEARRAALYKQADAKAEAAAQAARVGQAARLAQAEKSTAGAPIPAAPEPATGQSAERSPAAPLTNNSASPN
jgi:hypothetical protein